jgi:hypothetical protein
MWITLIYTFQFENKLQYLGLNQKDAESLAPLFFFSKSCAEVPGGESVN